MAIVSSHLLNSTDGTHAGYIPVRLIDCESGALLFEKQSDPGGRLHVTIDASAIQPDSRYELIFNCADYWHERGNTGPHVLDEIILSFRMPEPHARYHMPVIIAPNGYSCWKSVPEPLSV